MSIEQSQTAEAERGTQDELHPILAVPEPRAATSTQIAQRLARALSGGLPEYFDTGYVLPY